MDETMYINWFIFGGILLWVFSYSERTERNMHEYIYIILLDNTMYDNYKFPPHDICKSTSISSLH